MRLSFAALLAVVLAALAFPLESLGQETEPLIEPVTTAEVLDPPAEDWLMFRGNLSSWGYSGLDKITRDNVSKLDLAWSFPMEKGPNEATPVVRDGVMFLPSPGDVIHAMDAATGDLIWEYRREWPEDLRTSGYLTRTASPINRSIALYGDSIYATTGDAYVIRLNASTGELVWESPSGHHLETSHSTGPIIVKGKVISGRTCAATLPGGCWIMAHDAEDGRELWSVPVKTGAARNIVTPVLHEDTVTVASHTVGTFQVRISNSGAGQKVEEVWRNKDVRTNITTPVLKDGYIYGLGTSRGKNSEFVCLSHKTGKTAWSRRGYDDYASVICVGDTLLIHGSRGALTLLKATPEAYTEIGRLDAASQLSWNFPVYSEGVLYLKDGIKAGGNKLTALRLY